jgi:2-keto-4-pentenoate hydratase/2-oxohepta-3-ene-1,7-dioic acid hydratase in catechol pathway
MKLATLDNGNAGHPAVLTSDNEFLDLSASGFAAHVPAKVSDILGSADALAGVQTALDHLDTMSDDARQALRQSGSLIPFGEADLLAPVPRPNLILSVGLNYHRHLAEMAGTPAPKFPSAFMKTGVSLTGSGKPIVVPPQCPDMIDYEAEFCFVFGRTCHNASEAEAMDYVAGYTIANDVSARDWVSDVFTVTEPFPAILAWERNIMGKLFPTFTPCGPVITTKDEIDNPHDLLLEMQLNGETMQSTRTDDLIFNIPQIVSYFSKWYRFEPGDIVTTGTPAGVGAGRKPQIFMKPGDRAEVSLEGVGVLSNPVMAG